jgi:cysteine-rich repeat protein
VGNVRARRVAAVPNGTFAILTSTQVLIPDPDPADGFLQNVELVPWGRQANDGGILDAGYTIDRDHIRGPQTFAFTADGDVFVSDYYGGRATSSSRDGSTHNFDWSSMVVDEPGAAIRPMLHVSDAVIVGEGRRLIGLSTDQDVNPREFVYQQIPATRIVQLAHAGRADNAEVVFGVSQTGELFFLRWRVGGPPDQKLMDFTVQLTPCQDPSDIAIIGDAVGPRYVALTCGSTLRIAPYPDNLILRELANDDAWEIHPIGEGFLRVDGGDIDGDGREDIAMAVDLDNDRHGVVEVLFQNPARVEFDGDAIGCSTDTPCVVGVCSQGTCRQEGYFRRSHPIPVGVDPRDVLVHPIDGVAGEEIIVASYGDADEDHQRVDVLRHLPGTDSSPDGTGEIDGINDDWFCDGEARTVCGNGEQEAGEACDDGNRTNGDGCNSDCTEPRCGDGRVDFDEACDDGNNWDFDACAGCVETAFILCAGDAGEACDVRNTVRVGAREIAFLESLRPLGNEKFAQSVAIDGDVAVAGSPLFGESVDDGGLDKSGLVTVFTRVDQWDEPQDHAQVLRADPLIPLSQFGKSLAIDQNEILVGSWKESSPDLSSHGSAHVFRYSDESWNHLAKLQPGGLSSNAEFGTSVALSEDDPSGWAIVGAPGQDGRGAVYIFGAGRLGEGYALNQTLSGAPASRAFGQAVAVVSHGNGGHILVVGAPGTIEGKPETEGRVGAVYVFTGVADGVWPELPNQVLQPNTLQPGDGFGTSVAIRGRYLVVGAPYRENNQGLRSYGAAYVFRQNAGGVFVQTQELVGSDRPTGSGLFGRSVSISGDKIVVGSPLDEVNGGRNQGKAYVFTQQENDEIDFVETNVLTAANGRPTDRFGDAVAVDDGTVIVGGPHHNRAENRENAGAAFIFSIDKPLCHQDGGNCVCLDGREHAECSE